MLRNPASWTAVAVATPPAKSSSSPLSHARSAAAPPSTSPAGIHWRVLCRSATTGLTLRTACTARRKTPASCVQETGGHPASCAWPTPARRGRLLLAASAGGEVLLPRRRRRRRAAAHHRVLPGERVGGRGAARCGGAGLLPRVPARWWFVVFMDLLLFHRRNRQGGRCAARLLPPARAPAVRLHQLGDEPHPGAVGGHLDGADYSSTWSLPPPPPAMRCRHLQRRSMQAAGCARI